MPCLNEARTIEKCVADANDFLIRSDIKGEVLVADNGSTDGSKQLAITAGARVIDVPIRGYGAALIAGINEARGRYIVMGDADDSYDFTKLEPFREALRSGAHLVMGNRFEGGIAPGAMPLLHRWLGNPVLSALGRVFFRIPVGDFHCGLRAFNAEAIRSLHLTSPGMEFATEMVAKASFARLQVTEVPTTLKPDGRGRPPHLRTWRDGWRHLRFMLLFSPLWLFFIPGGILLALGLLGLSLLSQGTLLVGRIGLDVHTMLFCSAATVLGVLAIQWGAMIQWLGVNAGMRIAPRILTGRWISKVANIEIGILAGISLFIPGFFWAFDITQHWAQSNFPGIDDASVLRQAILACTLMIIGIQIIGGSLFAGALNAGIENGFIRLRNR